VDTAPANETRRVNHITYRVESLERGYEELRADNKLHNEKLTLIGADLQHVKETTDDLVRSLGGRVLLGASSGAGLVTVLALALMEFLKRGG